MSRDDAIFIPRLVDTGRIKEVKAPRDAALNPLLVRQRRPDVVRLRDHCFIWSQNHLRAVLGDVQRS